MPTILLILELNDFTLTLFFQHKVEPSYGSSYGESYGQTPSPSYDVKRDVSWYPLLPSWRATILISSWSSKSVLVFSNLPEISWSYIYTVFQFGSVLFVQLWCTAEKNLKNETVSLHFYINTQLSRIYCGSVSLWILFHIVNIWGD